MVFCSKCGIKNEHPEDYCFNCGTDLNDDRLLLDQIQYDEKSSTPARINNTPNVIQMGKGKPEMTNQLSIVQAINYLIFLPSLFIGLFLLNADIDSAFDPWFIPLRQNSLIVAGISFIFVWGFHTYNNIIILFTH